MPMLTFADVQSVTDFDSLCDHVLRKLDWPVDANAVENSFDWNTDELGVEARFRSALTIRQLRPLRSGQPFGIFLVEFASEGGYVGALREVLRGLVPRRRASGSHPTWQHENLLFLCTHNMSASPSRTFAATATIARASPLLAGSAATSSSAPCASSTCRRCAGRTMTARMPTPG